MGGRGAILIGDVIMLGGGKKSLFAEKPKQNGQSKYYQSVLLLLRIIYMSVKLSVAIKH